MSFRGLAPFPSKNEKPSARSCKKGYKLNSHKEAVFLRGTKIFYSTWFTDFGPVEVATVGAALVEATLLPPLPSLPLLVTRIPVCNKLLRSTKSSLRLVSILIMLAYECRSLHFYKYIYVYIRVEWKKIIIYPGFGQGCFQYFQHIVNS